MELKIVKQVVQNMVLKEQNNMKLKKNYIPQVNLDTGFNKKKEFYFNQVFLKFLLKKGNINKAKKIFKNTFYILFNETGLGSYSILAQVYSKLHINFEIRRIKIRRSSHLVPVPLNAKRRYYLICKWIFDAASANDSYQEFSVKLAAELLKIVKNQNCESLTKKKMIQTTAISNRSNTHYRW